MSLNEDILKGYMEQLNLAIAKRSININANLPTDRIDERIAVLNDALDEMKREMIEDAIREAQK